MKKLVFLLSSFRIGGGNNVILEYAARINRHGQFCVFIATESAVKTDEVAWHPLANEVTWITIDSAASIFFDVAISTWWTTCYKLYKLNAKSYLFFNQSVESRFYDEKSELKKLKADSAYLLGMQLITEASWIKNFLYKNYAVESELVLNGIRKDIYTEAGPVSSPRTRDRLRILVEGPLGVSYKNTEKTIELCVKSNADEVWLLTRSKIDAYKNVNKVFSCIDIDKTPEIYRSCDVLVKLSYVEGMFGPPLEMFHCGGTAIVYDVTGHEEYIRDNENAFVVATDDEAKVIESINYLKENPTELERLKSGARKTAAAWYDWESASIHFEAAIEKSCSRSCINQEQLMSRTLFFERWARNSSTIYGHKKFSALKALKRIWKRFMTINK